MGKIAFLVLGHGAPGILSYFTSFYTDERFRVFVHIDKKFDVDKYRAGLAFPNAVFLNERQSIYWGGFNMIRATLALIRAAVADQEIEHFCLVSDTTFPLVHPDALHTKLRKTPIWIECRRATGERERRYQDFFFFDGMHSTARWAPTEARALRSDDLQVYDRIRQEMGRGKKPVPVYTGSQWWILDRRAIDAILALIDSDEWLLTSLEFSAIPDEHFFQTLLVLSSFANPETLAASRSSTIVDFSREPKPFVFSKSEEVQKYRNDGRPFIRKVANDPGFLLSLVES